jgi:hypothetical protein
MADSLHKGILQIDSNHTDQSASNPRGIDVSTRHIILFAAFALVAGACTSGESATTVAPSTTAAPTTTTAAPDADVCTVLKVADFDLSSGISEIFSPENFADPESVDEEQLGQDFADVIVEYYDTIAELGNTAPGDIRDDFATVAAAVEPLRSELETLEPGDFDGALSDFEPEEFSTPELEESASRIESWTNLNCDVEVSVDPESVLAEKIFAAAFASLGGLFEELGEGLGDLGDLGDLDLGDLGGIDDFSDTFDAVTLGDNAELDALWGRCQTDDYAACDELYFSSFNVYELFSVTCAGTVPFYAFSTTCDEKHNGTAQGYGDDGFLDSLYDSCADGDPFSCDQLFGSSPIGSEYESFARTCGDLREASNTPCELFESGEPFTYGDDPAFDSLWDACSIGDADACDDLYFESPFGSAYEAFGENCRLLAERGEDCALVAELLDGPVG